MLRTSVAMATLGGMLASGLAALSAQAQATGRAAPHGVDPPVLSSGPGSPRPLAARHAVALALARQNWLRSHMGGQLRAAIAAAGITAAGLEARNRTTSMLTGVVRGPRRAARAWRVSIGSPTTFLWSGLQTQVKVGWLLAARSAARPVQGQILHRLRRLRVQDAVVEERRHERSGDCDHPGRRRARHRHCRGAETLVRV